MNLTVDSIETASVIPECFWCLDFTAEVFPTPSRARRRKNEKAGDGVREAVRRIGRIGIDLRRIRIVAAVPIAVGKGAVSVYGMGRFPVTLYVEQWERLDSDEERKRRQDFIKANASKLTRKN